MEETDEIVGFHLLSQESKPFAGAGSDVLEVKTCPHLFGHPVRDGGSDEADEGDEGFSSLEEDVGSESTFTGLVIDDIGAEDREMAAFDKVLNHLAAHLDVMIAEDAGVVADVVAHVRHSVQVLFGLAEALGVEEIGRGRALQQVAPIDEDCTSRQSANLLGDKGMDTLQRTLAPRAAAEIIGEEIAVHIGGEDDIDFALSHVLGC